MAALTVLGHEEKVIAERALDPSTEDRREQSRSGTDAPGSGPTAVAFVAIVIFAFVVASRRSLRAIRIR